MQTRSRRAEPLSPEERRQSILTAVIPLLIQKGSAVTSAEMAEAAGVAEGTIFRVFADKTAIINEAVKVTIDPGPTCEALAQIDPSTSLEDQLVIAARILLARIDHFMALAEVARSTHDREATHAEGHRLVTESNAAISEVLTELFASHAERLRVEPSRAVAAFRGLVLAAGNPMMAAEDRLTINEVVPILMTGIADS